MYAHPEEAAPTLLLPPEAAAILADWQAAKRTIETAERILEETTVAIQEMLGNHVSGSVRDPSGATYHVSWKTMTRKAQPEKIVPAKPAETIRLKTIQVKEVWA